MFLSNASKIFTVERRDLPIRCIALSVMFEPKPRIDSLHSLFRCSLNRSHGIVRPGRPCTLTVQHQDIPHRNSKLMFLAATALYWV